MYVSQALIGTICVPIHDVVMMCTFFPEMSIAGSSRLKGGKHAKRFLTGSRSTVCRGGGGEGGRRGKVGYSSDFAGGV